MAFKGHFEKLMWQQSPLKTAEQSAFPLMQQLSPSFCEKEQTRFVWEGLRLHTPQEKKKRRSERRKEKRKEGGGRKRKKKRNEGILHISELQESIWLMSVTKGIRITFPETHKRYS